MATTELSESKSRKSNPVSGYDEERLLNLQIEQALKYYNLALGTVRKLEHNLNEFLSEYYNKVGKQFQQLVALHERVVHSSALHFSEFSVPVDDAFYRRTDTQWDAHIKSMYRKLIKTYHPDVTGAWKREGQAAGDMIVKINSAYANKDVSMLYRLDMEKTIANMSRVQKKAYLRDQLETIQRSVRDLVERRQTIKKSPSYQLMKKVQDAREQGIDLIAVIKEEVQEQIDRQMAFIWHNPLELLLEEEQLALLAGHA